MTHHGWPSDTWPGIYQTVLAADILVLAGPIWLGDNSSVMKRLIEQLYTCSHLLNDAGQYAYYGTARPVPGRPAQRITGFLAVPQRPQPAPAAAAGRWRGRLRTVAAANSLSVTSRAGVARWAWNESWTERQAQ